MAAESTFMVPENLTFEAAIALSTELLDRLAAGAWSAPDLETAIAQLVATENGARGFFVTYLSDERAFADTPSEAVLAALRTAPAIVAPLLIKNLVMSTAMIITHHRHDRTDLAQGSARVQARSRHLIQQLHLSELTTHIQAMQTSLTTPSGDYQPFLTRWGYDAEQKNAMHQALATIQTDG